MNILFITLGIVIICFIICGIIWANIKEKKDFNNGICPKCGTPLRHFDDDSQGGQLWCCDKCGYFTAITWFKK